MSGIKITSNIDNWISGAGRFSRIAERIHQADVEKAGHATFEQTQQNVHRITHSLALSGKLTFEPKFAGVKVLIVYGGESAGPKNPVSYAAFEWYRGGPHDWMTPAIVATADQYPEALRQTLLKAVRAAFN